MVLLQVLLLLCQEDVYIRKIDKARYIEAVQNCKDAESKIESDETLAIDKLSRILLDATITEVECTLRIQTSDIYGPPYLFLPYQYRARARMSLAKKSGSPAEKKLLLEEAVQDLKASAAKKVASSTKYLETAQAELKKLAEAPAVSPVPESPLVKLRPRWSQLLGDRKFKSARALVEGGGLADADRATLLAETEQACRAHLTEQMRQFRRNWASVSSLAEFQAFTRDEFQYSFALPAPEEIVVAHPAYDWARAHAETLRTLWSGKSSVAPMLAMAGDAARLEEGSDNPWFRLAEALAYQDAKREIERRIGESLDAPRDRRETLVGEAQAIRVIWTKFSEGLDAGFRSRQDSVVTHGKALAGLFEKAPRDLPEVDAEDLRSCFEGFPVDARLLAQEEKLAALDARGGISLESRQKLYTLLVAARSTRLFLAGKTDPQVRQAVKDDLEKLSRVGGAVDPDRFGPRVRKVFE